MASEAWLGLIGVALGGGLGIFGSMQQAASSDRRAREREIEARMWEQRQALYLDLIDWCDSDAVMEPTAPFEVPSVLATRAQAFGSPLVYQYLLEVLAEAKQLVARPESSSSALRTKRRQLINGIRLEFGGDELWKPPA
ncbi:hypothetical protein [Kribbella sp. DT2]|uniref:hypothetical protein n=1 Tax=Kribbella sp. DT2 TaxID=3393427 RepID=UPI003CEFD459